MPNVQSWLVYVVGTAVTVTVVGWLTSGFRRLPNWLWQGIHVIRTRLGRKTIELIQNIGLVPNHDFASRKIEIDLRSQGGVVVEFNTEIPMLSLWFRITNLNDFELWFDRMIIEVWVGQPTIYGGAILDRFAIQSGETRSDLPFLVHLDYPQQAQVFKHVQNGVLQEEVKISTRTYFQSKDGWIQVAKQLTQRDLIVRGAPKG